MLILKQLKAIGLSLITLFFLNTLSQAQTINRQGLNKKNGVTVTQKASTVALTWPVGGSAHGRVVFDLAKGSPLFKSVQITSAG
ncbi:MAG TPA: hypothetical protein VIQ77_06475, partial [Mucilaginibacter sp.]